MSQYSYSVSLIVPAAMLDKAQHLAWAIGHDEPPLDCFGAELTSDGATVTHYGLHTYAMQSFVDILVGAQQGQLPPIPWADYGLTEQDVLDVVASMTIEYLDGGTAETTWANAALAAGVSLFELGAPNV